MPAVDAVIIGSSAGGPPALQQILGTLPADLPAGIVVVQHMPLGTTGHLASLLSKATGLRVREAGPGDQVKPGIVLIVPAGKDISFAKIGRRVRVCLAPSPPEATVTPSIDRAFRAAAAMFGHRLLGVLLTGMGDDGARGLLEIRKGGGRTIAEAESSAKVYGMPKVAAEMLAAQEVRDLSEIGGRIVGIATDKAP